MGITISQARSPSISRAVRQSSVLTSQRASGESRRMPAPLPAETTAAAIPRRWPNHLMASTVRGT